MNSKKFFTQLITSCVLLGVVLFATRAGAELKPGDVLDKSNWQEAKGLMPDAILKRFAGGQHISKIVELPPEALRFGKKFLELSEANQQLYDVDDRGGLYVQEREEHPERQG